MTFGSCQNSNLVLQLFIKKSRHNKNNYKLFWKTCLIITLTCLMLMFICSRQTSRFLRVAEVSVQARLPETVPAKSIQIANMISYFVFSPTKNSLCSLQNICTSITFAINIKITDRKTRGDHCNGPLGTEAIGGTLIHQVPEYVTTTLNHR